MSKVLILVGSPRIHGNTELLAEAFAEGVREQRDCNGNQLHEVEILNVARMNIALAATHVLPAKASPALAMMTWTKSTQRSQKQKF